MKAVYNSIAVFAASLVISWAAPVKVQDDSTLFHQGSLTNGTARITLERNTEPKLVLGSKMEMTGLFVDCVAPRQTWSMMNPSAPVGNARQMLPPSMRPVTAPRSINDPAVHEPDFALFRVSFP